MVEPKTGAGEGAPEATGNLKRAFEAHHSSVLAYALRRTSSRQAAEDIAAEVFAIASRRADELPRHPKPWLLGVTRGVLANHYRSEQRKSALVERIGSQPGLASHALNADGSSLAGALISLPDDDRELLLLRYWDGLNGRELSRAVGCSLTAVYVRLHRARTRLADELWGTASPATEEEGS